MRGDEPLNAAPLVSRVAIPSPEDAGVTSPGTLDWTATRRQLAALGATEFGLGASAAGSKFFLVLPRLGRVEGEGRTEAEAVAAALGRARRAR